MKKLIIAEKPSVAKNIADAVHATSRRNGYIEGNDYVITWAFGHLLQLYDAKDYDPFLKSWRLENFPYIPEVFQYKIKTDSRNRNQTDSGANNQIELLLFLHVKKPAERLLLNEWTADEVEKGLSHLRNNSEMQSLQDAGMGRQLADWLIGINLTSVATVKYRADENVRVLNVGRVLLPTLKIIYDRDKEIEQFTSSKYYKLLAVFQTAQAEAFEGTYYENGNEKFEDKEFLENMSQGLTGKTAVIISKKIENKKDYPPYLFNLSNLQGYITNKYKGWTSDRVLKVAQSLYEKKYITYPRTASAALDESLIDKTRKTLEILKQGSPFESEINFHTSKRVFDSKKVESHSAIIPTYVLPKSLTEDENNVYTAIKNRFLAQFMPVAESEETTLEMKLEDGSLKGTFISKGKVILVEGWKKIEQIESKETILPHVQENEKLSVKDYHVSEVVRKPPKAHTEKTLLRVMETCGKSFEEEDSEEMMMAILSGFSIGTPATRAETIKKLKDAGYIQTKGKSLVCTPLGKMMVETFPVKELFDLEYTGRLEKTLFDIEKKKFSKQDFLSMIITFVKKSVDELKNDANFGARETVAEGTQVLGKCPECGSPVVETPKAFGCSNWKNGCKFAIWKNDKYIASFGKQVSSQMVQILLENGRVGFHGCKSKKGNKFSAYFRYIKDEETGRYHWSMEFIDEKR
jgi:DNA topoisomerase-3